jgi:SNF2 family DNA or RNA helicase
LDYDSDSDSDSSIEVFVPTFNSKIKPIVLDDSSDSSGDSVEIINGTEGSSKKREVESDTAWSLDSSRDEYFLESSPKARMPDFFIPSNLYNELFDHQKTGVAWMAGLHSQRSGGLLGDDMGMGK